MTCFSRLPGFLLELWEPERPGKPDDKDLEVSGASVGVSPLTPAVGLKVYPSPD